ncbi:hypothetical protein Z517_09757 [Fonsecaea pedrosoi CBS 271.37]|uniref:Caspase family p20 domain-containing protein n=1 Tax=Fonsecaea pedrosoi CBS 271.37 TaxID=1442368 RepID=A0A0D2DHY6_9EURO|nr:uncharacterized protein Z517_09757 [Fonsecaea pedrosoi CBS 271.37]KIW77311.1 hypothetical protein Z517_09757 [Fonsecaea pedrosoi CBS 271.37]
MFRPERVKVLLLTFSFNDLDLHKQTRKIHGDFESLGYEVQDYNINMSDPLSGLKTHLSEFLVKPDQSHPTLHIIYYHGHGGIVDKNKLRLFSHNIPNKPIELGTELSNLGSKVSKALESNKSGIIVPSQLRMALEDTRFQPVAGVNWEEIQKTIMDAKTHTIIILDCREAVLASVTSQENGKSSQKPAYQKELIGACGWGLSTRNDMSEAMCTTFKGLDKKDDTMSTITLVSRMNHHMVKSFGGVGTVPQAVRYLLGGSTVENIRLPRLKERPPQTT